MAVVASLDILLGANTAPMTRGFKRAQTQVVTFSSIVRRAGAALLVTGGAMLTVATATRILHAITARLAESYERLDGIAKAGISLDILGRDLQAIEIAATLGGSSLETATKAMFKLQKTIGEAKFAEKSSTIHDFFRLIKTDSAELETLGAAEQFGKVAEGISKLEKQTDRAAASQAFFGRAGRELLPFLLEYSNSIERANRLLDRFGLARDDEDLQIIQEKNDVFAELGVVAKGVSDKLAVELAPTLKQLGVSLLRLFENQELVERAMFAFVTTVEIGVSAIDKAIIFFDQMSDAVSRLSNTFDRAVPGSEKITKSFEFLSRVTRALGIKSSGLEGSFDEYNTTIKKTAGLQADLSDEIEGTDSAINTMQQKAEQLQASLRTPFEILRDELRDINELSRSAEFQNLIDDSGSAAIETKRRAIEDAIERAKSSIGVSKPIEFSVNLAASRRGSQEEFKSLFEQKLQLQPNGTDEKILDAQLNSIKIEEEIRDSIRAIPAGGGGGNLSLSLVDADWL